jgi:REP element-mobilizing transposase RayT
MPRHYTSILTHVVFATHDRRPLIKQEFRNRLNEYVSGIISHEVGKPIITQCVDDHLHSLFEMRPTIAIADAMRLIKTNSSKWIHEEFQRTFAWQAGYGAFSVSRSNVDVVYKYIERQEEHHRKQTFDDEFRKLLDAHGVSFDEKYLFK